jgi:hypothetical protein
MMYEVAMERIADQHRLAEQRRAGRAASQARKQARATLRRNARNAGAGVEALPAIDFADELLAAARDKVPAQRLGSDRDGRALPGR